MTIAVVGIGYVGLVSATCFADLGVEVHCIDINQEKINGLKQGIIPIYEPGLEIIVKRCLRSQRLHFSTSISEIINKVDIIFIAVGTPSLPDGSADLNQVISVAQKIGKHITKKNLIVIKSTVPVGTSKRVKSIINEEISKRGLTVDFEMASNPEFLKEGSAIEDFMRPDRVIVGVEGNYAEQLMTQLYRPMLLNKFRVLYMDVASAEMSKYAANAMLATRISFMNELALLCEKVGADIKSVRQGIGSDHRIGDKFLYAGCGYGGSCFPKDVNALIHIAKDNKQELSILQSVERVNDKQKRILFQKFYDYYKGKVKNKKVSIWGLAFKPETDDIRQAPALILIDQLLEEECQVSVYDPIAMPKVKSLYGEQLNYAKDIYECSLDADAIFHVTEWKEYRMPSWKVLLKSVNTPLLIDGRNVFDDIPKEYGFTYLSIGKKHNN